MKDAFDSYTDLIISNDPSREQILNAFAMISAGPSIVCLAAITFLATSVFRGFRHER
jgi:hypothetical protein